MPTARDDDLIVLIGAYEGVASASRRHRTGVATVRIEAGEQPIYLVLSSYEAIRWALIGDVARVRQVVVSSYEEGDAQPPRGAAGPPQARVQVFRHGACLSYFTPGTPGAEEAQSVIARRLGRPPDVVAGDYTAIDIQIPPPPPARELERARPEAAGPMMRPGDWLLSDDAGAFATYVVRPQSTTRLIFRIRSGICMARFRWWREGQSVWRFRSDCEHGEWGQIAEGRAIGDFQTSFAFSASVRSYGFSDPDMNGDVIVRVQGQRVELSDDVRIPHSGDVIQVRP